MIVAVVLALAAGALAASLPVAQERPPGRARVQLRDVSGEAGVDFVHQHSPTPEKHYVESAPGGLAVFDYNGDGRPDLFFTNGAHVPSLEKRSPAYSNRLYRNDGGMRFTDITEAAGVGGVGYAMGAAAADYDNDGHVDLFVAGSRQNQLLRNDGSMGTDFQDYDNDGWADIFLTALSGETFPLFRNDGRGAFIETTQATGLTRLTAKSSGWCAVMADIDNDGWKDFFTANSHVNDRIAEAEALGWKQASTLLINDAAGHFPEATTESGLARSVAVHRGCGVADFNGDGRLDIAVLALGTRAELWQNDSAPQNRWLIVRLIGSRSNRDGIGARVIVGNQVRTMSTASGYASSSHAGLHFGLAGAGDIPRLEVQWPSGPRQTLENVRTNQVLDIREK